MNEELKNVQTINDGEMSEAAGGAALHVFRVEFMINN